MSTWLQPQALIGLQPTMSQGFGQVRMWHGLTSEVFNFHDDENSDSSWNVHVLAGHTPDTIASPKKFSEFRYCEGFMLEWYFLQCDTMHICRWVTEVSEEFDTYIFLPWRWWWHISLNLCYL
jgi:hypothetical protein